MPTQRNNNRRPNGNGGNNHAVSFWAVTMTVGGDLDLLVEGQNGDDIGLRVCSVCAALIPGSDTSQQLHRRFHETINGIDARTAH